MKLIFTFFSLLVVLACKNQDVIQHEVKAKGVHKEIDLSRETLLVSKLTDSAYSPKSKLVDSVEQSINNFAPPALYITAAYLFKVGEKERAMYWFYLAQVRARYDVNRCADKSVPAATYNQDIGPPINQYAFAHIDTLEQIMSHVITFIRSNNENYDQRWINMEGMSVFTSALGDKQENKPLSIPKNEWPAIKTKTIDEYYNGFKEVLAARRAKQK